MTDKITKTVYFWSTGFQFKEDDVDRIYDEMKYNYYFPSNLTNGLTEEDYGAFCNFTLDEAKEFAKNKVKNLDKDNSFCFFIKQEFSLSEEEWNLIADKNGIINLTKFGVDKFPEFIEPTYSIVKNNENEFEENTIHIKTEEQIEPVIFNLVTSDNNQQFRLLNKLYSFADKVGLFDKIYSQDLLKLNGTIRAKNQSQAKKVQTLDKLGKAMQSAIPLKVLCYMISDIILILGNRKEYSEKELSEIKKEKEQIIKSVKDYAKKSQIDIEDIFDKEGKLKPREETIDNPEFNIKIQKNEQYEEVL